MNPQTRNFAFRLIVVTVVLLSLGEIFGTSLVKPILPTIAWEIETIDDSFRVDGINVVSKKNNNVIQLKVSQIRPMIIGDHVLQPKSGRFFEPNVLVGSVLQPIIVFLTILLSWQAKSYLVFLIRLLLAVPVTTVLFATNTPLAFVGAMWDFRELVPNLEPHTLVYWNDFLQTGGPLVMAIAAALLVVSLADRWANSYPRSRQASSLAN
ncbi:hypothetical protein [Sideroxydans sp. CL21]|uniref:hypothetical protein n=1 Tax=Sideroxydans sp. CL21 TaxID=2600596 RepID=UPI0024BD44F5|nr:hypothetical protein [Sideroxydans sp. CL21]